MIEFFTQLGKEIEQRWARRYFDNRALPEVAARVLDDMQPHVHVSYRDLADWVAGATSLPPQPNIDSTFGQPPLTVWWHPKFYVEALHWTVGTTQIHQHGFSGAFCVLAGSSLQSTYEFITRTRVNVHMLLGDLLLREVVVLRIGDIQPIESGDTLIHSVFHLDYPSVTLVVRTHSDVESKPQYSYFPPHLAIDPYHNDPVTQRRCEMLEFLHRLGSNRIEANAAQGLALSDPIGTYRLLRTIADICDGSTVERLIAVSRAVHGQLTEDIWSSIQEGQRQKWLIRARQNVKGADSRFLLALLMNVRSRTGILNAVRDRYPDRNPLDQFLECCWSLTRSDVGIEFDALNKALFTHLLSGVPAERVPDALCAEFSSEDVEHQRSEIVAQCRVLCQDSVFQYVLAA